MKKATRQLFAAVDAGDEAAALEAIAAGAALDAEKVGVRPLDLACVNGMTQVIEALLRSGAEVHRADEIREPIQNAAMYGRLEVVRLLLAAGAKPDRRTVGGSAFDAAIARPQDRDPRILELLVAHGATPSAQRMKAAVSHRNEAAIRVLSAACVSVEPPPPRKEAKAKVARATGKKSATKDAWKVAFLRRDWRIVEAAEGGGGDEPEYDASIRHINEVLAHAADTAPRSLRLDDLPFQRKLGKETSSYGAAAVLLRKLRDALGLRGVDVAGELELIGHEEWNLGMRGGLELGRIKDGKRDGRPAQLLEVRLALFDLDGHLLAWSPDLDAEAGRHKTRLSFADRKTGEHQRLTDAQRETLQRIATKAKR